MANVDWNKGETREIIERNRKDFKKQTMQEKLESGFCAVGGHKTEDHIYLCKHCKRTFCYKHGDEDRNFCNECIMRHAIDLR